MSFSARTKYYFYDDESERDYHLPIEGADWLWDSAIIERDEHGRIVRIKYIVQDDDPTPHPLDDDDDGYWQLGTSSTRDSRKRNVIYKEARGLDHDWNDPLGDICYQAAVVALERWAETGDPHFYHIGKKNRHCQDVRQQGV